MHRETPVFTTLSPMGWTKSPHKDRCRECGGTIQKGDPAYMAGGYICCQMCFTEETTITHPTFAGERGPAADWVWRPSRSQEADGWTDSSVRRKDGSLLEWMDRLDIGPLN